jgi:hypothetical protein
MIQQNEMVMLLIGIGVLFFIRLSSRQLKRLPSWNVLLCGFCALICAWISTVLEGFFWSVLFNYLEHLSYAASSALLTVWCWKWSTSQKGAA